MIKHVKFKKLGRKAQPLWCKTTITETKTKPHQEQKWASIKKELEE